MGFVKVCAVADIPDEGLIAVEVEETPVAVVCTGGELFAISNLCSHAEVELSDGEIYQGTIECSLHGSCFDIRTGKPTNPPATRPIAVYRAKVDEGDLYVSVRE